MLTEWTGLKVDAHCLDPRPPQMQPPNIYPEGIPFFDARPPQDRPDRLQDDTSLQSVAGGIRAPYGVLYPNGQNQQPGALSPLNVEQSPQVLSPNVLADDVTIITGVVQAGFLDPGPNSFQAPDPEPIPEEPFPMTTTPELSIYPVNGGGSNALHGAAFDAWLGKPASRWMVYLNGSTWAQYVNSVDIAWGLVGSSGKKIVWSLGFPGDLEQHPASYYLSKAASGAYNGNFRQMAQKIAGHVTSGPIPTRPFWEMNGDWYPWSAPGSEANFNAAWRNLVTQFRAVSDRFVFNWCPSHVTFPEGDDGTHPINPEAMYPGDDVVSEHGMDVYLRTSDNANDLAAWGWKLNGAAGHGGYGLDWALGFAHTHNKPMTLPEWAIGREAPAYVGYLADWIFANNISWHNYFDTIDGIGINWRISTDQFPLSSVVFKAHFGLRNIWTPVPVDVATFVDIHGATQKVQTARKSYSMARHAPSNSYRYEVRKGDIWSGDATRPTEYNRAETESPVKLTIGQQYDYAFQARTTGAPLHATIISQLHAKEDAGDQASHAEYQIRLEAAGRNRVMTSYVTDNTPNAAITEMTLFDAHDWVEGRIYNCVLRIVPSGGAPTGVLKFWRDGVLLVNQTNIRIGYPNVIGPYFKSGIYRQADAADPSPNTQVLEVFNLEGPTTSDLTGRNTSPPAIPS